METMAKENVGKNINNSDDVKWNPSAMLYVYYSRRVDKTEPKTLPKKFRATIPNLQYFTVNLKAIDGLLRAYGCQSKCFVSIDFNWAVLYFIISVSFF